MTHIIILGGSYGGVLTAHRILKATPPSSTTSYKITLVAPNTHFYWNPASPRALAAGPSFATNDQLFAHIAEGFAHYPQGSFEFVNASATNVDFEKRSVTVEGKGTRGASTLSYDILVLATGTRADGGAPFKGLEDTAATQEALRTYHARARKAKHIVVGGSGITGVEVVGELGHAFKGQGKEIVLIASGTATLDIAPASVQKYTATTLGSLGVRVQLSKRITSTTVRPDGRTELSLSDGTTLLTDLYISTFGLLPNSAYIPDKYLNAKGFVVTDEHLRVKGVAAGTVYAVGDVSAIETPQIMHTDNQSKHVGAAIAAHLAGSKQATVAPYKAATVPFIGFQIGPDAGTAFWGTWRLPSFLVVYLRKTLFIERMPLIVSGKKGAI